MSSRCCCSARAEFCGESDSRRIWFRIFNDSGLLLWTPPPPVVAVGWRFRRWCWCSKADLRWGLLTGLLLLLLPLSPPFGRILVAVGDDAANTDEDGEKATTDSSRCDANSGEDGKDDGDDVDEKGDLHPFCNLGDRGFLLRPPISVRCCGCCSTATKSEKAMICFGTGGVRLLFRLSSSASSLLCSMVLYPSVSCWCRVSTRSNRRRVYDMIMMMLRTCVLR
jgi:hypothetical protein